MRPLKIWNELLDPENKMPSEWEDELEEEPEEHTIATDLVVTKYNMAADIVNDALVKLMAKCVDGAKMFDIFEIGDRIIGDEISKVFKKNKEIKKGISFPLCISINNCICHFSPLKSDPDIFMKNGDVVKIDFGVHLDGFCNVAGNTMVVGATPANPVTGRRADVILAAYHCAEAALRLIKPGGTNIDVTDAITRIAAAYKCKPIEGMLSHQLKKFQVDGEKTIILNPNEAQRKEHPVYAFEMNEVYAIDILVSSGEGKAKEIGTRTTVYKKNDIVYNLKMKTSRQFFSEVEKKFINMPFTLRMFEDEKKARLGVVECVKHELVDSFNVLYDKEGEFVAQFKYTVLLMPNGPLKVNKLPFDPECYNSEYSVQDENLKALLSQSVSKKAARRKKKKMEQMASYDVPTITIHHGHNWLLQ